LLGEGTDVNCQINRQLFAPLHDAITAFNSIELMKVLLQAGANVDIANKGGLTPLHFTSYNGKPEAARLLIQAESKVCIKKIIRKEFLCIMHNQNIHRCQTLLKL
jgi:ankyrin repeat protein